MILYSRELYKLAILTLFLLKDFTKFVRPSKIRMKSLKPNMLSWQKTVMKPTMLNLLKVLPVEIKSLSLKLNKEKLSENI
jgi:hypothetical protein